ncbi:MAG: PHP domain-containing protein [Candidatus Woesearchaeota archaeon]
MLIRAKVDFHKPDIYGLKKQGFTLVDMHVHTRHSDTYVKVPKLLRKAERLGIGLAITDHNTIEGVLEARGLRPGQLLIPGIEITCAERCHILVYFYRFNDLQDFYHRYVLPNKSRNPYSVTRLKTVDLLKYSKEYACLVVAAHPFSPGFAGIAKSIYRRYLPYSSLAGIDAFEVLNGVQLKRHNWKALQWAEDLKKPFTGGSDAHSIFEVGKVVTYARKRSVAGFLDSIMKKQNYIIGKQLGLVTHFPSESRKLRRHLRYIRPTIGMRYEVTLKPAVRYHVPRIRKRLTKRLNKVRSRVNDIRAIANGGIEKIDRTFEKL